MGQGCLEQKHHPEKTVVTTRNDLGAHRGSQDTGTSLFPPQGLGAKTQPHRARDSFGLRPRPLPPPRVHKGDSPLTPPSPPSVVSPASSPSSPTFASCESLHCPSPFSALQLLLPHSLAPSLPRSLSLESHSLSPLPTTDPGSPAPTLPGGLGLVLEAIYHPHPPKRMGSRC